ncbi:MAG: hypothetical protein ABI583_09445 [Betaproteobacteria bacterium]
MLKWVRERFSVLALRRDRSVEPVGQEMGNHQMVGSVALAGTRHIAAISSTLFVTSNTRQFPVARERLSGNSTHVQRRPGVHARWKEKNRLPMQTL